MKKLMILGAGPNQVPLIQAAKKKGYYTYVCDYSSSAPGVAFADELCLVSIMDKDGVLQAAREKQVDGVISNSEPAMPIVAYVGNSLALPSNSEETIGCMTDKVKFRRILSRNSFRVPAFGSAITLEEAKALACQIGFPLMMKPGASSGSRGVKKIVSLDNFDDYFHRALEISRTKEVILEEFIENQCAYVTGGDIFVSKGEVVFWGLMSCIRDQENAPLVPMGEIYPPVLTSEQIMSIKKELTRAITALGFKSGAINVEIMLDAQGNVFFVELNPRNGGNMIPEELQLVTGFDIFTATVTAAVGDELPHINENMQNVAKTAVTYMVHTMTPGVLKRVSFSDEISKSIVGYYPDLFPGDPVEAFFSADKKIGVLILKFGTVEERNMVLEGIKNHIFVELE